MNICILSIGTILYQAGGVEVYVHELAKRFASDEHKIFVICSSIGSDGHTGFIQITKVDGVNYIIVPIPKIRIPFIGSYVLQMILFGIKSFSIIRKLDEKYKFDIVHSQFCCGFWYALMKALWRKNIKFIVTLHGTLVDEQIAKVRSLYIFSKYPHLNVKRFIALFQNLTRSLSLSFMEYLSVKFADGIIASSYNTLTNAIKYYSIRGKKCRVVYSGADLQKFKQLAINKQRANEAKSNHFTILFVGRADDPIKGINFLIQAASKLVIKYQSLRFILVGPETDKLYNELVNLGLKEYFILAGKVPYLSEALLDYYWKSDIFILSSLYEGFGLVVIEAFAARKPVIAFGVGSLFELIQNGVNGFIVKPFDVNALVHSIEILIKNPRLKEVMGIQAEKTSSKFNWSSTASKTINFYKEILGNKIHKEAS